MIEKDYFDPWLVGFVDGEGSFFFNIRKRTRKSNRRPFMAVDMSFQITLRDDDKATLLGIQDYLKAGKINNEGKKYNSVGFSNPHTEYRIFKIKDLVEKIIPIFDKYKLRTRKSQVYKLWRELVLFCDKNEWKKLPNEKKKKYSNTDIEYLTKNVIELKRLRKYDD